MSFRSLIHNTFKAAAEAVLPPASVSQFATKGTLTPQEYLDAGDLLVRQCPTWQWEGGDPKKRKPYLPPDKQYLVTRGVPSTRRASEMEQSAMESGGSQGEGGGAGSGGGYIETDIAMEEGGESDEGWTATHTDPVASLARHQAALSSLTSVSKSDVQDISSPSAPVLAAGGGGKGPQGEEEEVPDIDDDQAALPPPNQAKASAPSSSINPKDPNYLVAVEPTDNVSLPSSAILKTRTYDLFITYDQFYCVPRLWLSGFDEKRNPLAMDSILQDVSEDHARKTVTSEPHPHLAAGLSVASIHPCRHGEVMRRLVDKILEAGGQFEVEHYMLLFLKFISSIVPTIQYDWTMTV